MKVKIESNITYAHFAVSYMDAQFQKKLNASVEKTTIQRTKEFNGAFYVFTMNDVEFDSDYYLEAQLIMVNNETQEEFPIKDVIYQRPDLKTFIDEEVIPEFIKEYNSNNWHKFDAAINLQGANNKFDNILFLNDDFYSKVGSNAQIQYQTVQLLDRNWLY